MSDRSHGCGRGCIHIAGFDIYDENQKASKRIVMLALPCRAQLLSYSCCHYGPVWFPVTQLLN